MPDTRSVRAAAKRVRAAHERLQQARADLDLAISEAKDDGATLRELAEVTGLSFARIHQIVHGR